MEDREKLMEIEERKDEAGLGCQTKRTVYVVGHKNPDTDSICSAISYAYLKTRSVRNISTCRQGQDRSALRRSMFWSGLGWNRPLCLRISERE